MASNPEAGMIVRRLYGAMRGTYRVINPSAEDGGVELEGVSTDYDGWISAESFREDFVVERRPSVDGTKAGA